MLSRLQLLRNVGQFDSVSSAAAIALTRLTLMYAENGRGKTTLAAIFRSLATGDPIPISERRRLAAAHAPHVVLDCSGGPPAAIFQNNQWNRTFPDIVIFDDIFVHENVCSGLEVDADHRQRLHELILGSQAVGLTRQLQRHVAAIETHNASLRTKSAAILPAVRGPFSVDDFCVLTPKPAIDAEIEAAERTLAAVRDKSRYAPHPFLSRQSCLRLMSLLSRRFSNATCLNLDSQAAAQVLAHLSSIGPGGEAWVSDGINRITGNMVVCPLCAQDLSGSPILQHYRAYFSRGYAALKQEIVEAIGTFNRVHGDEAPAAFERAMRLASDRRQFWSRFCEVPELNVETAEIVASWRNARRAVLTLLQAKQSAPLERLAISGDVIAAIDQFNSHREAIAALRENLTQANTAIHVAKEQAAAGNPTAIQADLARLKSVKDRFKPEVAVLCAD